ncbi:bifunctional trypsin-like peptidase domain-containing/SEL1-like repeat protein [Maliponia aquimaris]|uniref:Serine protease n=1 Tax=Maliponia aquimaris TaxID=1673631 RepID=A0A238L760_9RHOB|nr:bifunctional trypsin-like peptidase domain-containing/SEL1-like repeat protein [Maliponia aquimaris]SMX50847.1 Chromosome partition protein Smc [Maliponia aquimaris]
MRRFALTCFAALAAVPLAAQPVEFDPADFGKIIVAPRQSTGTGVVLEQAFGDYQNEPVLNYGEKSIARRLGMPVGRLDVLYKNGKSGYCTAFIVDPEHLVTNHHCIPGLSGDGVQAVQFVAGYLNSGQAEGAEKFQVATEALESSAQLDYSVLRVFGDPSARFGAVEIADADPEASEFLWIIGHPQGQVQHISREGCAAADPPVSEGKVVHSCDTLGGNSGSPVFRVSDRKVVALHHAGDSRTGFNFAIPMTRILKNSKILKAAAAPPSEGQGACQVLWNAAGQHGCLGYQTFLTQCADHPLAPLARGLADQVCTDTSFADRIAEADRSVAARRAEVARAEESLQAHAAHVSNLIDGLAARRDAAGIAPEVQRFWQNAHAEAQADRDAVLAPTGEMPDLLRAIDAARAALTRATTTAEVDTALATAEAKAAQARDLLAAATQRRTALDARLPGLEAEAARLAAAASAQGGSETRIAEAEALRGQVEGDITVTRILLEGYPELLSAARSGQRRAEAARAPAAAEVADLWQDFARDTAFEYTRARTRMAALEAELPRMTEFLKVLKVSDEAEQMEMAAEIARIAGQARDWRNLAAQQVSDRKTRLREIEAREALLREQHAARPAVVTRCLELGAPQFSVEGIEGVATSDFDERAAFEVCSEAVKVSDEVAVRYALARAQYELGNQSAATAVFRALADEGFLPAMYHLGTVYNSGRGVPRDYAKALKIFEETAAAGYPQGKFSLGVYYSLGRAVRTDHTRAAALLIDSIADGYAHPITQLGKLPNGTIRAMQADLAARGLLSPGDVDGAFGPRTRGVLEQLVGTNRR